MMDYGKLTLDELKKGFTYDEKSDSYICNYCDQCFQGGQVFSIENNFYMAEHAAAKHVNIEHGGSLMQLIHSDTKYNTLTQNQKELLELFHSGASDREMAGKLGVTESTIRRQRFTFREKAKQVKFYLAVYEPIFGDGISTETKIVPIHDKAAYVDHRYLITEQERERILKTFFSSLDPLVLKVFSPKEKKKVVILREIAKQFQQGKQYSEKEVNRILKPIFEDYTTVRRYLIMYGFMGRAEDGSNYWLTE